VALSDPQPPKSIRRRWVITLSLANCFSLLRTREQGGHTKFEDLEAGNEFFMLATKPAEPKMVDG
jgi:hypothetical protein